jgi:hypothetical protein
MKNFLLGAAFGAVGAVYFTGNLKINAEGISITTNRSSSPESPVQPPTVAAEPYKPPPEPPTAA